VSEDVTSAKLNAKVPIFGMMSPNRVARRNCG